MPYRTFADDQGKRWEISEVHATHVERREADRRGTQTMTGTGLERLERRDDANRRTKVDALLDPSHPLVNGWLLFKSDHEKRRLAPIPRNWETCHGGELRELWERAQVTAGRAKKSA